MRAFRHLSRVAVVLALAWAAACTSIPPSSNGGPPPRTHAPAAAAAASAAAKATPAALRVASSGDYAPFSSIDSQGVRSGLDIEVAERFAHDVGLPLDWVPLTWANIDAATVRDGFDVAMSGVTLRPDRALIGRYTRPMATTGAVAVVRAADAGRFATPDALDRPDVRLAVNSGGHLERVTRARFPHAVILPQSRNAAVPLTLRDGRADAAISDTAEAHMWLNADLVELPPFTVDHKGYLLPIEQAGLATQLDAWLRAREADGWLNAARVRWLGQEASMDAASAARQAVAALIRLRLDLMPAVVAAKRSANLPIEDRAQEARVLERVRGQVPADPGRAAAVYSVLIEMAKAVQRDALPLATAPPLDSVRVAIGRIDETLCAELQSLPASPQAAWQSALSRTLGESPDVAALSRALAY
ncbi:MAG: transporter substrate-binding domain-containing protein [bacterium]